MLVLCILDYDTVTHNCMLVLNKRMCNRINFCVCFTLNVSHLEAMYVLYHLAA